MIAAPVPDDADAKRHTDGTHRACPPAETLARLAPQFQRFGITRVANLTGLDRAGLPVAAAFRPNARSSAVFHGKGLDLVAAKASAVMEAIETWHAENAAPPLLFGNRAELCDARALVDTTILPRGSHSVLSPHQPLLWAEGRDLVGDGPMWVPFELVHADYTVTGPPATGCLAMTTNGLASGNTFWEATSHALCEVVERDATALWRASSQALRRRMRLDLATVADAACRAVLDLLVQARLSVGAWDITTEVGVPAFQCLLGDAMSEAGPIGSGAGCHPAREIALLRALTEAAQVRMTYIAGSREDLRPDDYAPATRSRRHRAVTVEIGEGAGERVFGDGPGFASPTFAADVAAIVARLRHAGFAQAVVVDLSRPDLGIAVVRAIVPGLEGSDHAPDFLPGHRVEARRAAA